MAVGDGRPHDLLEVAAGGQHSRTVLTAAIGRPRQSGLPLRERDDRGLGYIRVWSPDAGRKDGATRDRERRARVWAIPEHLGEAVQEFQAALDCHRVGCGGRCRRSRLARHAGVAAVGGLSRFVSRGTRLRHGSSEAHSQATRYCNHDFGGCGLADVWQSELRSLGTVHTLHPLTGMRHFA